MSKNIYSMGRKVASFDNRGPRGSYRIVPTWRMKVLAFRFWLVRKFQQAMVIGAIAGIGALMALLALKTGPTYSFVAEKVEAADNIELPLKIARLKASVVNDIKKCESAGHKEDDGLVTFDPDKTGKAVNIPSFGVLQFKVPTVIAYEKKLNGINLTPKEAILLALDEDKATALATQIIFDDGGWGNWYHCGNKANAAERVKFIKQLETI